MFEMICPVCCLRGEHCATTDTYKDASSHYLLQNKTPHSGSAVFCVYFLLYEVVSSASPAASSAASYSAAMRIVRAF